MASFDVVAVPAFLGALRVAYAETRNMRRRGISRALFSIGRLVRSVRRLYRSSGTRNRR
jgi:hypothetical protein